MIRIMTSPTQGGTWLLIPSSKNGHKRAPLSINWEEIQQIYRATSKIMARTKFKPGAESRAFTI